MYNNTIRKGYAALAITSSGLGFGLHDEQLSFEITGKIGTVVIVEASTDLLTWLPIRTNTLAGPLNFNEAVNGPHSDRFYRVHAR